MTDAQSSVESRAPSHTQTNMSVNSRNKKIHCQTEGCKAQDKFTVNYLKLHRICNHKNIRMEEEKYAKCTV